MNLLAPLALHIRRAVSAGLLLFAASAWAGDADADMQVRVQQDGETMVIDVNLFLTASPVEVWQVLTDFDHMHHFVSSLRSSKVVQREGNRLTIAQAGSAAVGVLTFAYESLREVQLEPYHTIRTHQLSGSAKRFDGLTRLLPDGEGTRIRFHGESVPDSWLPVGIGARFIERQVQQQFQDMRVEILKRKNGAGLALLAAQR